MAEGGENPNLPCADSRSRPQEGFSLLDVVAAKYDMPARRARRFDSDRAIREPLGVFEHHHRIRAAGQFTARPNSGAFPWLQRKRRSLAHANLTRVPEQRGHGGAGAKRVRSADGIAVHRAAMKGGQVGIRRRAAGKYAPQRIRERNPSRLRLGFSRGLNQFFSRLLQRQHLQHVRIEISFQKIWTDHKSHEKRCIFLQKYHTLYQSGDENDILSPPVTKRRIYYAKSIKITEKNNL
ncbi:hypothetical protein SDC9_84489 [bioreactor metagenome]|uniref:Uncharacterized protein n=1 Tax=bioreactor metagenome TaxID=1076179 RepID=A0A644ZAG0_9ZZZZ